MDTSWGNGKNGVVTVRRNFSLKQLVSGKLAMGWVSTGEKEAEQSWDASEFFLGDELIKLKTLLTGGEAAISKPQGKGT